MIAAAQTGVVAGSSGFGLNLALQLFDPGKQGATALEIPQVLSMSQQCLLSAHEDAEKLVQRAFHRWVVRAASDESFREPARIMKPAVRDL